MRIEGLRNKDINPIGFCKIGVDKGDTIVDAHNNLSY